MGMGQEQTDGQACGLGDQAAGVAVGPSRFEQEFLDYLGHNSDVLSGIASDFLFGDDRKEATVTALADFKQLFRTAEGKSLVGREEHAPLADEEIGQETIVRQKRG